MIDFTNKKVLITGASSGIGKAIAQSFLDNNAIVTNIDKNEAEIQHKNYSFKQFDLLNTELIDKMFYNLKQDFDILVNNAGILYKSNLLDISLYEFKNVFDINFIAAFKLTQIFSKELIKRSQSGKIVNISSINGKVSIPSEFAYSISKSALDHLTRTSAVTLAKHNILVNAVCPGSIKTNILRHNYKDADKYVIARTPLGRWGEPLEVSNLVMFLASNLNTYMTGECINIDGGRLSLNFFKE
jgi:NAD(P)-dependent dehydrogenase (short-subunit alcohol dehydrogenase family)